MGRNKDRTNLYLNLCLVMMWICLVGIGYSGHEVHNNYKNEQMLQYSTEEISGYMQCDNLSLEETANCLRGYVSTFYNYTIRDDEIRTIEDIKKNGGDCYDYNKLYERMGKELGFETFSFGIKMGDEYHRVSFITDKTGYCLLDQLHKVNCFYGAKNEE